MYGVINGVYYCNMARSEELNSRISSRNIPSGPLQPQLSLRSVSTKYAHLPVMDRRAKPTVEIERLPTYNVTKTFNPGNAQAPWSGFAANVNVESTLRNQFFALQKCEQSNFVPPSTSDLYQVTVDAGKPMHQPFPQLFQEQNFEQFNPNECGVGKNLWGNFTRQQRLDSNCCDTKCSVYL